MRAAVLHELRTIPVFAAGEYGEVELPCVVDRVVP
jgi:hypothetical protein